MTIKSARALFKRRNISTGILDWIIDRQHVSASDEDIAKLVRGRIGDREPANVIEAAVTIAIARHQSNRGTYRFVTGGIR